MNKKGQDNIWLILLIILAILVFSGILTVSTGIIIIKDGNIDFPFLNKHKYLTEIQLDNNITRYEDLKIDVFINNPHDSSISPELEIDNTGNWRTSNRYIRNNDRIPIKSINPNNLEKYSIEFDPPISGQGNYSFHFALYISEELVDEREVLVYVR